MTTPVWTVRLSARATRDFTSIVAWSRDQFGPRQAKTYRSTLLMALAALHDGPTIPGSKVRDDIGLGIRTLHVTRQGRKGRHFVIYDIAGDDIIQVLAILHDGIDLSHHVLPSDKSR